VAASTPDCSSASSAGGDDGFGKPARGELAFELEAAVLAPGEQLDGGPLARGLVAASGSKLERRTLLLDTAQAPRPAPYSATTRRGLASRWCRDSLCSSRKSRAFSLPWPMRSPSKLYHAPDFSMMFCLTPRSTISLRADAGAVQDSNSAVLNGARPCSDDLHARLAADDLFALLDRADAADVEPDEA